jgi:hypothetical protein
LIPHPSRLPEFRIVEDVSMIETVTIKGKQVTRPDAYAIRDGLVLRMHPETAKRYRETLRKHGVIIR